jgi:putative phosphoribosyl transferase
MRETKTGAADVEQLVHIPLGPLGDVPLEGALSIPPNAAGIVVFAHGSGSSRHSPRNNAVARTFRQIGLATLLLDLLSEREDESYAARFDIGVLTERLGATTTWLSQQPDTRSLRVGYFGASTGAAAALEAAAGVRAGSDPGLTPAIRAVVSRGGRPDLARWLERVTAPTLLIVGSLDREVLELNRQAFDKLTCQKDLAVVPGATHLFEEPGTLDEVARLASSWFVRHLGTPS